MFYNIKVYVYSILLVIGTVFPLRKAKKLAQKKHINSIDDELFQTPHTVAQKIVHTTKTPVYVEGKDHLPEGPALFVANHQGLFDILALIGFLGKPIGFIAKKEIKKIPIVKQWMELLNCVFIDRNDRRQSVKAINQGIRNLKNGHSMVIFPEGTRRGGRQLNPFKPGSLRMAFKAKVPIVPVTIDGTYKILEEGSGRVQPSTIYLTIHAPIWPEDYEGKKTAQLVSAIEKTIAASLKKPFNESESDPHQTSAMP
ncbi:MAG TPA: lysophospholipid acyltransferase family protein [Bacillota bacterium]|nr:lysophospholipid acyltransferase family protein [Bacillota bacterium]